MSWLIFLAWWFIAGLVVALLLGQIFRAANPTNEETVLESFDAAQNAYRDASRRHNGQADAWKALRDANNAKLKAGL